MFCRREPGHENGKLLVNTKNSAHEKISNIVLRLNTGWTDNKL